MAKPKRKRRKRNHKEEYRRRIERAEALGLSHEAARGHPKEGEPTAKQLREAARAVDSGDLEDRHAARDFLLEWEEDMAFWADLLEREFDLDRHQIYTMLHGS